MASESATINTHVHAIMHTHPCKPCSGLPKIEMLQLLTDYSELCIITSLTSSTMHLQMLRMTHLGNKLLVLLVQISSGSHIVSPYSQPALLGKPGNKARMQITQMD